MATSKNEEVAEIQAAAKAATGPVDTVLAVSRHADGTPAQTDGFKSVDPERTAAISERQLTELQVSAVDHQIRTAMASVTEGDRVEDPINKALREAHEAAAAEGAKRAQSEKVES